MIVKDLTQQNAADIAYLRKHRPDHFILRSVGEKRKCPRCPYVWLRPSSTDRCPKCGEYFYRDPIIDAAWWVRSENIIPDPMPSPGEGGRMTPWLRVSLAIFILFSLIFIFCAAPVLLWSAP